MFRIALRQQQVERWKEKKRTTKGRLVEKVKTELTQLSSARIARMSQIVTFLHVSEQFLPPIGGGASRTVLLRYKPKAVSFVANTSVRECQNDASSGLEAGDGSNDGFKEATSGP